LTYDRKSRYISLGVSAREKEWSEAKCRVYDSAKDSYVRNDIINAAEIKAKSIIYKYKYERKPLPPDLFLKLFHDDSYGSESFYTYVEQVLKRDKEVLNPGTLKGYNDQLNKLKTFQPSLRFTEITASWIDSYSRFLANNRERKNNANTINKSLSFIRSILNRAKRDKKIEQHVFENEVSVARIEGNREYLTLLELESLWKLYHSGKFKPNKANVLRYFLFSCYTGLRYSDVKELRFKHIHEDWISMQMKKTNEKVRIPIHPRAKKLLPGPGFDNQQVFKVLTDQPTNRYLKDIMNQCGIKKTISFHSARHTFATACLERGISMEAVQSFLGHTDRKSTAIYGRMNDGRKRMEMEKWSA
jgi:site-specific recombinase XerD